MIKVEIKTNAEKMSLRLKVKGHSAQAERGQDIVCASASILTYTVAQVLKDMGEKNKLTTEPVIILKDGNATVSCICKTEEDYYEALSTFNVAYVGYILLSHNFPQFVEVSLVGKA